MALKYRKFFLLILISLVVSPFLIVNVSSGDRGSSSSGDSSLSGPGTREQFVVFAWNDLGMHCLNPTYSDAVILPPYNNLIVQVIKQGNPPQIVTSGLTVEYRIINNTYSYGKTDTFGGRFAQFWDNSLKLFGITLPKDTGLNLVDSNIHNGLSGSMLVKADYFVANGIPVSPVDDNGVWNPYQVAEITVKDSAGTIVAQTRTTIPTSDEINCQKCHGAQAFTDILSKHDARHGTGLVSQKPVFCSSCHGDPVLGVPGPGTSGKYLSLAIHESHALRGAVCYDCHPGNTTKCNRSIAHAGNKDDGNCTNCHGTMTDIATSISSGKRIPWVNEPKCVTCHPVSGVNTVTALYRMGKGHGNLFCADCHGSPHATIPTSRESDNYQALQYQKKAKTIGSCSACHLHSKGKGLRGFGEEHGGPNPKRKSACSICHISVSNDTTQWPHAFGWKNR